MQNVLRSILVCLIAGILLLTYGLSEEYCPVVYCAAPECTRNCSCVGSDFVIVSCDNTGIKNVTRPFIESIPKMTQRLSLESNRIDVIQKGAFEGLENLLMIFMDDNEIREVENGAFASLTSLLLLMLRNNRIRVIKNAAFQGLTDLQTLHLSSNEIEKIEDGAFGDLTSLESLHLDNNPLKTFNDGILQRQRWLKELHLETCQLEDIRKGMFEGITSIGFLYLRYNRITEVKAGIFPALKYLTFLYLTENEISSIQKRAFANHFFLELLLLGKNSLTAVKQGYFDGLRGLTFLELSYNKITHVEDMAFKDLRRLKYLGLSGNRMTELDILTLEGLGNVAFINLAWNPIRMINNRAFEATHSLTTLDIMGSSVDIIPAIQPWTPINTTLLFLPSDSYIAVRLFDSGGLAKAMINVGFVCRYTGEGIPPLFSYKECRVCPTGTYTKSFQCLSCPPGGLYQDVMGYAGKAISYGLGCKQCPPGRYVHPDLAPGRAITECTSCPQGTQYNKVAQFRACFCLETFIRLDRFGPCLPCPSEGLTCQNESVDLKPGFYWKWKSQKTLQLYKNFTRGLQNQNNTYDRRHVRFADSFPRVYACPMASCLGGMMSSCAEGYEGPLCGVCSKGYYQMISSCKKCPSKQWLIGQIIFAVLLLAIITLPLVLGKKIQNTRGRSLTDVVLARLKIFIGFYQVTSGTLDAFTYITWPKALLELGSYAKFLQFNLLQIAPVNCFANSIRVTTYTSFLLSLAIPTTVTAILLTYYHLQKFRLRQREANSTRSSKAAVSETKETCLRYAFLVIYIVYPTLTAQIFQVLPTSCKKICVDSRETTCQSFLSSDFNLECYTNSHNNFAIAAYCLLAFVIGFPVVTLVLLRFYRETTSSQSEEGENEIGKGLSFLYENYSESCWFWEVLELVRKIILTSVLAFMGSESRTNLGVAATTSGLYNVLYAYYQPITDRFEHWLQLVSLMATSANMNIGMLLKIPQEDISLETTTELETTGTTVILVTVNLMVTGMIVARYLAAFYTVVQAVRKRPQCNMECCLSVAMIMNDAGEDVVMFEVESDDDDVEQDAKDHIPKDHIPKDRLNRTITGPGDEG